MNTSPFMFESYTMRVPTRDDEPWFVLAYVCGVSGILVGSSGSDYNSNV